MMTARLPKLARLAELGRALDEVTRVTEELHISGSLQRFAADDPERWDPLCDALALSQEQAPGTIATIRAALAAALMG